MNIEHRPEGDLGSFFAVEGGKEAGELAYRIVDGKVLTLDHTDVEPEYEGKGIGKRLVAAAVEHARAEGMKVRPLCNYALVVFERSREWDDLRC